MKYFLTMLSVSLLLAGCVATRTANEDGAEANPTVQAVTVQADNIKPVTGTVTTAVVSTAGMTESAQVAQQQGLQDKSIYFDFDTFLIKPEYRALLKQHVAILKAHPKDSVTLEGNADERGSPEYNLAIGNKRAHAVKVQLTSMGIDGTRIHEVSFGEEKPRAACHEERCWQQNRRVDFAYRSN